MKLRVLLFFHLGGLVYLVKCSNILVHQHDVARVSSHIALLHKIGCELASRGNNVMVLTRKDVADYLPPCTSVVFAIYDQSPPDISGFVKLAEKLQGWLPFPLLMWDFLQTLLDRCDHVMANNELLQKLEGFHADVMVYDAFSICSGPLAARLGTPTVAVQNSCPLDPLFSNPGWRSPYGFHMPVPVSYLPVLNSYLPSPMTFVQRLKNSFLWAMESINNFYLQRIFRKALAKYGISTATAPLPAMLLINSDFALEWRRPLPPNVKMVGPAMLEEPKTLPKDLLTFIEEGENGFVLVAMGSQVSLDRANLVELSDALGRLPTRVLWKLSKAEILDEEARQSLGLKAHMKVMEWLPQIDLLAQPKIKAFLTHGGINSVFEAMWYGVPLVVAPQRGDQPDNAVKVASQGAGLALPRGSRLKAEEVYNALMRVIEDASFREQSSRIGRRLRSHKRTGLQRAADWIEYVANTEGDNYLRLPLDDMHLLIRSSVDVILFWCSLTGLCTWCGLKLMWQCLGLTMQIWRHLRPPKPRTPQRRGGGGGGKKRRKGR
eukprot:jgi/Botrbrau1/14074/Bobra.182_3s0021.1